MPKDKQHGDIQYYTIMYKNTTNLTHEFELITKITGKFYELENLTKYTFYDIKVSAATRVGSGPASKPFKVRTDEDSKWKFLYFLNLNTEKEF